jgi:hypothetical protein
MNKAFGSDDVTMLENHLKAIAQVEFFTIGVYLTAVYSFTQRALSYSTTEGGQTVYPLFVLQQKTLSVAVQEMYHLQEAANIVNAFNTTPDIPQLNLPAGQTIVVPHLDPNQQPLDLQLGALPEMIKALIAIEAPDSGPPPQPNLEATYPSIGDLYAATLILLGQYMAAFGLETANDPHFTPGRNQVAYQGFSTQYRYNTVQTKSDVLNAEGAIVNQGEGPESAQFAANLFAVGDDVNIPSQYWSSGSRFDAYNTITHFARFEEIQQTLNSTDWETVIGGPVFYQPNGQKSSDLPPWAPPYEAVQSAVTASWSYLIDTLQSGFASGGLDPNYDAEGSDQVPAFSEVMLAFKYLLPMVWQYGYCPSFTYQSGVTGARVQQALDGADPYCLFHWDARTRGVRASYDKNACQGLNECAGQGWGGIGTQPGDGACATADLHTCGANNSCRAEGGCGFLVSKKGEACGHSVKAVNNLCGGAAYPPPWEEWIPGENACGGLGGCQTPIGTGQRFNSGAKDQIEAQPNPPWSDAQKQRLEGLMGTDVWTRARALFAAKIEEPLPAPISKEIPPFNYDGQTRRSYIEPTSK